MSEQKIGNAIRFEQDPSKFSALLAYMAGTVDDPKWDMSEGRYALWGFREQAIARNIIAADVQSFSLKNNQIPLLTEIIGISFGKMKTLILDGNNIESVEALVYLNAPQLSGISLNFNKIVNLNALRACQFPRLKQLSIKQNQIKQLAGLAEWDFPLLQQIHLQSGLYQLFLNRTQLNQSQNLSNLSKLSSPNMKWIFFVSQHRILFDHKVYKNKWVGCQIRGKVGQRRNYNIVISQVRW